MYDFILVPTDGSEAMAGVVAHAADLAVAQDASLSVLSVVDATAMDLGAPTGLVDEAFEKRGRDAVDGAAELAADRGVEDVTRVVVEGSPAEEIIAYAAEEPVDLVVMGTHGRRGLNRHLLGSVAERVVRTAPVPVMTLRIGAVDADEGR